MPSQSKRRVCDDPTCRVYRIAVLETCAVLSHPTTDVYHPAVEALLSLCEDFRSGGHRQATERVRMELTALGIETEPYGG